MLFGEGCRSGFAATSAMTPRWVAAEPLLRNFRQRTLLGESPSAVQVKTIAGARLRDWRKKRPRYFAMSYRAQERSYTLPFWLHEVCVLSLSAFIVEPHLIGAIRTQRAFPKNT